MTVLLPLRLVSRANQREHWAVRNKRDKAEKRTTRLMLPKVAPPLPVVVHLTRVAPRALDDDNLRGAFKAVRDAVAEWLGADDRPGSGIRWEYAQAKAVTPKTYMAQVVVLADTEVN